MSKLVKFLLISFLILLLAIGGLAYWGFHKAIDYVASNADSNQKTITQVSIDKDTFLEKRRAFETFKDKLFKGECEQDFVLEGEDINVIVKDDEEQSLEWTKWSYANIVDSYVDASFSIPLGKLDFFKKYDGKFLNGDISCKFSYSDEKPDEFTSTCRHIKIGEKTLVEQEGEPMKQKIPANIQPYLKALKQITMEGNKITFTCKPKA